MFFTEYAAFLHQLSLHNNREWFELHREQYLGLKERWLEIVTEIVTELHEVDPEIGILEPKQCIFRINRDTRFSKSKIPYKTNLSAVFVRGRMLSNHPGYYFEMDDRARLQIGGGLWMPEGEILKNLREYLQNNGDKLHAIMQTNQFSKYFGGLEPDMLKTVPRGYAKDAPNIDLIKYTSWTTLSRESAAQKSDTAVIALILDRFMAMKSFKNYLIEAIKNHPTEGWRA